MNFGRRMGKTATLPRSPLLASTLFSSGILHTGPLFPAIPGRGDSARNCRTLPSLRPLRIRYLSRTTLADASPITASFPFTKRSEVGNPVAPNLTLRPPMFTPMGPGR